MTSPLSTHRRIVRQAILAMAAIASLSAIAASAQRAPYPKVDFFGGYSYFYPNATLTGVLPNGITPVSSCLCDIPRGAGATLTYNFLPWLGLSADLSGNWSPHQNAAVDKIGKSSFYSLAAGPKFTYRGSRFMPFAEALFGEQRLAPNLFHHDDSFGIMAGAGLDIKVSRHIAIRPIRADFAYSNHTFGINPAVAPTDIRGMRLEAGITFLFGYPAIPTPVPAPPVEAPIAPTIVPPVFGPPTITCSSQPSSVNAGDSSTITSIGNSPQGLPLTYSYASTAGSIGGDGATTTLVTAGVAPSVISVTCNVVDSRGQTASAGTTVTVIPLVIAPKPSPRDLCSISFTRDPRRPVRVDNEAKACLDDIALTLQKDSDATLIVIGDAQTGEAGGSRHAAERAINTKAYLVMDKGIDPARISVYTGAQDSRTTNSILVPAGATPDTSVLTPIDESRIANSRR